MTVQPNIAANPAEEPSSLRRVGVVVPARDEADGLALLIPALAGFGLGQLVIADNASSDGTGTVARGLGADVVREEQLGYGAACVAALGALRADIEIVVFLDADLADDPEQLPRLVAPIQAGEADLVIGCRPPELRARGAMTPPQAFGNRLATWLIRLLWSHAYTDLGPFRAIRRSSLEQLDMADRRFGWTVEMQVRALQEGLGVQEVEVPYRARAHGLSKISGTAAGVARAGGSILYTIGRLWLAERLRR
ncbi:MAG: glycosyltransferase family 2 protein [Candidatus Binatia bacterium]|nr:glycosyltransferase family 2 protein [Candidatus Binatia bacterium]